MALKKYPGFIDAHVHLREPGATHKEDFETGGRSAVKGGFTFIIDMPNNPTPTVSTERLEEKISLSKKSPCEIGFHFGTNGNNLETFSAASARSEIYGLKLYCNHTTGEMLIDNLEVLENVFQAWPSSKPILVHAEGEQLERAIDRAERHGKRLHVCHITQASEVAMVREAKLKGIPVTAGVCPHHLYLTGEARDRLKGFAIMKPPLGTPEDQKALWEGLVDETIDIVETDHAPHTREEKEGEKPAYGVPGLETAVSLMLKAVKDRKISEERLITALHSYPKKIFNVPTQPDTYVEIDTDGEWVVGSEAYASKAQWSPFEGWKLPGIITNVVIRGRQVVKDTLLI